MWLKKREESARSGFWRLTRAGQGYRLTYQAIEIARTTTCGSENVFPKDQLKLHQNRRLYLIDVSMNLQG